MTKFIFAFFLCPFTCIAQVQQNPPISFQEAPNITLPLGALPTALSIADFNQDRRLDVAVCEKGLGTVGVYFQATNGTFPSPNATFSVGQSPTGLIAVRLGSNPNRAAADLVALSGPSSRWTLLQNDDNGQGTFTSIEPSRSFGSNQVSQNPLLLAAYVDEDQKIDFVYTYDGPNENRIRWASYLGAGIIQNQPPFVPQFVPTNIAVDDFNRDGRKDMIIADPAKNELWIAYATGSGIVDWSHPSLFYTIPSQGARPVQVATGDVNRDSQPDIAVAHAGSNEITVFLNLGTGRFDSYASYKVSAAPRQVLLEDLNQDGNPELIVLTADNKLQIFQHTGIQGIGRYETPVVLTTGANPTTLQVADMDGDFAKDIVVGCLDDNTVRIYLNKTFVRTTATAQRQLAGVEVYPNPATNQLRVRIPAKTLGTYTASLLDQTGRVVRSLDVQDMTAISVADLPRGFYLLQLSSVEGISTKRLVVQ